MNQLNLLKNLLDNPPENDELLQFYLDRASDIICDLRNSDKVETKYKNVQIEMAIELYNKRGAEGQVGHSENGINRSWDKVSISDELLLSVPQVVKTPQSEVRVINE